MTDIAQRLAFWGVLRAIDTIWIKINSSSDSNSKEPLSHRYC